jgi:hypothetical protein
MIPLPFRIASDRLLAHTSKWFCRLEARQHAIQRASGILPEELTFGCALLFATFPDRDGSSGKMPAAR